MPTRGRRSAWCESPSALTVIRSDFPSGAAERENGCADQMRAGRGSARGRTAPARLAAGRGSAGEAQGDDARRLLDHVGDAEPVAKELRQRQEQRKTTRIASVAM